MESKKRAPPVNYNLNYALSQNSNQSVTLTLQKKQNKRHNELDKENYNESNQVIVLPSSISGQKSNTKKGNTAATKRILASRKTLNNYYDEDVTAANVVLNLETEFVGGRQAANRIKLCSICGGKADGSCVRCGLRFCSAACMVSHDQNRCPNYYG